MSKEVKEEAIDKIKAGVNELTMEERKAEVEAQIKSRDLRELEKCLIRSHQTWTILQKHAKKYNLEYHVQPLESLQQSILCELYLRGVLLIFTKHPAILRSLGLTGEDLIQKMRNEGLIEIE